MRLYKAVPRRFAWVVLCLTCAATLVSGCATKPAADQPQGPAGVSSADPYQSFNRAMFDVNMTLDKVILKPVAYVYKEGVPVPLQHNVTNFLANLRSPVILANDLMQGNMDRAGDTLLRFAMNSTIGLFGIVDFATAAGIPKHDEDFGQTLADWHVDFGPYLVLPIFGPSNPRAATGLVVDTLLDPLTWLVPTPYQIGRAAAVAVDRRARHYDEINDLEKNSLDFYSAVKSLYRQRRDSEIRNGAPPPNAPSLPGGRLSSAPQPNKQTQEATTDP